MPSSGSNQADTARIDSNLPRSNRRRTSRAQAEAVDLMRPAALSSNRPLTRHS